jgi:hypothetical protein
VTVLATLTPPDSEQAGPIEVRLTDLSPEGAAQVIAPLTEVSSYILAYGAGSLKA